MADQLDLFRPVSRKTDPSSSRSAEAEINRTGSRRAQQEKIFEHVRRWPGHTSLEMSRYLNLDRYQIARRLSDLKNAGLVYQGDVKKCDIGGRDAVTWFPAKSQGVICDRCEREFDQHCIPNDTCIGFRAKTPTKTG